MKEFLNFTKLVREIMDTTAKYRQASERGEEASEIDSKLKALEKDLFMSCAGDYALLLQLEELEKSQWKKTCDMKFKEGFLYACKGEEFGERLVRAEVTKHDNFVLRSTTDYNEAWTVDDFEMYFELPRFEGE